MQELQQMYSSFISESGRMHSEIRKAEQSVLEQSRLECRDLLRAKQAVFSSLIRSMQISQMLPAVHGKDFGHRLALILTFIQGCNVTHDLILRGQYAKSAAILKQDYELLCRLGEVRNECAKEGVTPKASYGPYKSQHIYGELNKAAHPSHFSILLNNLHADELDNGARGLSPLPTFRKELVVNTYYLHVWTVLECAREAVMYLSDAFGQIDEVEEAAQWFSIAYEEAKKAGFFKIESKL